MTQMQQQSREKMDEELLKVGIFRLQGSNIKEISKRMGEKCSRRGVDGSCGPDICCNAPWSERATGSTCFDVDRMNSVLVEPPPTCADMVLRLNINTDSDERRY
jgi:hypothetical protein